MPEISCLNKFKKVLVNIPEIEGFPVRSGRTFRVKFIEGMTANFDLLAKPRTRFLVVECCKEINMQQLLVGLPSNFGQDPLERTIAKAMVGFSSAGIRTGLGSNTLYMKGLITGRVQSLIEELKKGGNDMGNTAAKEKQHESWSKAWETLIDHLRRKFVANQEGCWEVTKPAAILLELRLFSGNLNAAKIFMNKAVRHGLAKRVGGRKYCKWHIYNLHWFEKNGRAVAQPGNIPDFSDAKERLLQVANNPALLHAALMEIFGLENMDKMEAFVIDCAKQVNQLTKLRKVLRAVSAHAQYVKELS